MKQLAPGALWNKERRWCGADEVAPCHTIWKHGGLVLLSLDFTNKEAREDHELSEVSERLTSDGAEGKQDCLSGCKGLTTGIFYSLGW